MTMQLRKQIATFQSVSVMFKMVRACIENMVLMWSLKLSSLYGLPVTKKMMKIMLRMAINPKK